MLIVALLLVGLVSSGEGACEVDLLFVLDASSSVRAGFEEMKAFVTRLTEEILDLGEGRQRAALLEYSGHTKRWPRYDFDAGKTSLCS